MNLQTEHRCEREVLLLAVHPGDKLGRLEQRLGKGIDWSVLVRKAIEHRVVPLLSARLRQIGEPLVPADISQALDVWVARNQDRNTAITSAVAEISPALQQQCPGAVLLHGPPLAQTAFGDHYLQQAVHPTLLLRAQDLEGFHTLLTEHDYKTRQPRSASRLSSSEADLSDQRVYRRVEDSSVIEVRTKVVPASHGISLDATSLQERAVDYEFGGAQIRIPSLEDLVLVWCVLGGVRGWTVLGELCDLAWLLYTHPEIDLLKVHTQARAQGLERILLLGLGLVQQLFSVPIDPALNNNRRVQQMLPQYLSRLLVDDANATGRILFSRDQLQLREGFMAKCGYAAQTLLATWRSAPTGRGHNTESNDTASITTRNGAHWGERSNAWEKWSDKTRSHSAQFSSALIAAADIDTGDRVLDLACGVGDTSLELSPLVGSTGLVMMTDLAFDMVVRARWRAQSDKLINLQTCTTAMESLPFPDQSFDGIVCRLGIMYCSHVQNALSEARRVLRPEARSAYLVCGSPDDNPVLKIVNQVLTELFDLEQPDATIDPFKFAEAGSLAEEMAQAGFVDIEEQDIVLSQRAIVGTPFWLASAERGLSLPIEDLPRDTLQELEKRMTTAFAPYVLGEFYQLPSLSRITRGTCPGTRPMKKAW